MLFHIETRVSLKYFVNGCSLKSEIDQLGIGKLETTPANKSKLSDVVKNEVVEMTVYYMN